MIKLKKKKLSTEKNSIKNFKMTDLIQIQQNSCTIYEILELKDCKCEGVSTCIHFIILFKSNGCFKKLFEFFYIHTAIKS